LRSIALFDVYHGRPLADDEKSLAYRLAFQADDRTLVEQEIDAAVAAVTEGLVGDVGGRLRG
jgi:phenylalanyl-tRNA synthetase beta chain